MSSAPTEYAAYPRAGFQPNLEEFQSLVAAYRRSNQMAITLLLLIAVYIGGTFLAYSTRSVLVAEITVATELVLAVAYLFFAISTARQAARHLGIGPAVSILLMLFCLVFSIGSVIFLGVIQSKLRKRLDDYGIRAGIASLPEGQVQRMIARLKDLTPAPTSQKLLW